MARWDTRLAVGLICGAAAIQAVDQAKSKPLFADYAAFFATDLWNYAPAALLIAAGGLWLWRQWQGPPQATQQSTTSSGVQINLDPLIRAFEQHAIMEHKLSSMATTDPRMMLDGPSRSQLSGILAAMERACGPLELNATRFALRAGIKELAVPLHTDNAYNQFRSATKILQDELDASRRFILR